MLKVRDAFSNRIFEQSITVLWQTISSHYSIDESRWVEELIEHSNKKIGKLHSIKELAIQLIKQVRSRNDSILMIDALLLQYNLDTKEGILLMCLAEALMRIPDNETVDALIRDKLSVADWKNHLQKSDSLLVNASTWGLMLTGKVVSLNQSDESNINVLNRLVNKMGEPVIRKAVHQAMKLMGKHFVLGRTIEEAIKNGESMVKNGFSYSFDMLGEAALNKEDADRYYQEYLSAIEVIGAVNQADPRPSSQKSSISIKLSALHPRYEISQESRVMEELVATVINLVKKARELNVGITIDAEEQDRLELSLRVFNKVYSHKVSEGWGQVGLVVQAYGKRALPTLAWLAKIAKSQGDKIPLRLVKGAYWDSEIKLSQQRGLSGYPVYTRKESTDLAYLVCAEFMLQPEMEPLFQSQFATHNAHAVANILSMVSNDQEYEFQRLHGMGDALYNVLMERRASNVRIYAPVGNHKDLLPYLVRRLLENGANASFVHRLVDAKTPVQELVHHPSELLYHYSSYENANIPLPSHIFGAKRLNSIGVNLNVISESKPFFEKVQKHLNTSGNWTAKPQLAVESTEEREQMDVNCPYNYKETVGACEYANEEDIKLAIDHAQKGFKNWKSVPVEERASCMNQLANLLEEHKFELIAMCHKEAGKTVYDSIDEIREAIDFCRYYADQALNLFSTPQNLIGPTGESNELYMVGRGVFACISPWNFPIAIFVGQISAAIVAGNSVIAKPAEQTSLIAYRVIELMREAGIPSSVIQCLSGRGSEIGKILIEDTRISGVAFTGSTDTARYINQALANRPGAIVPLIAETGGQNAMIVDSTALPEQVVEDVIKSAFLSAGQRCSALRVLYLQEDVAERIIELLKGAMDELSIGDPTLYKTDVGPVINQEAMVSLMKHVEELKQTSTLIKEVELPDECQLGYFVAPVAFEIDSIDLLTKEHFGPILHIIRYPRSQIDQVIKDINATGFGLTLGIHTRNEGLANRIEMEVNVGNTYINRDQIGAVVGVQPFGGQGLSGTGPKAGGAHYLLRFITEKTKTVNTTAVGGNTTLLSLGKKN